MNEKEERGQFFAMDRRIWRIFTQHKNLSAHGAFGPVRSQLTPSRFFGRSFQQRQMEKSESGRGGFFMISPDTWAAACNLGMNEAVAYLVLAQGTAGNNRTTSWSAEALHKYTGIAWVRGRAAIERLIQAGLLCGSVAKLELRA